MCLPPSENVANNLVFNLPAFEAVVDDFTDVTEKYLPKGESLTVTFDVLEPQINAEISKQATGPVIKVLGGMLKHPKMTKEVLSLLLCHEMGHYLGGPPLKSRNGWSSTEGQADYYSGEVCARNLGLDEETFLESALRLTTIYAEVTREAHPKLESCDETIVQRTFYGYPKVQCRLDTILAGWKNLRRPACWFVE